MHARGAPDTMMGLARYADPVAEVRAELWARREAAVEAGVDPGRILLDPGIGFAKELEHNLALLRALPIWPGQRVLVGASRKRFIGQLTGQARAADRLEGSLAAAIWAARAGAAVVRVHDVAQTRRALAVWAAIEGGGS
jgi:dihydropteroate synthase